MRQGLTSLSRANVRVASSPEVDGRLKQIMRLIFTRCEEAAAEYNTPGNYVNGANIGGFVKVAESMLDQGLV